MSYIEMDDKKIKRLFKEAQQFQDDIVCAAGTDFMQKVAEAENRMIFDILKGLESEPSADVVEVRHGEWIKKHRHRGGFRTVTVTDSFGEKHTGRVDNRYECDDLYCSVCGKIAHEAFLNYCANCGAKMDGERREE